MSCPICNLSSSSGVSLGNGTIVHSSCYSALVKKLDMANDEMDQTQNTIKTIQREIVESQQFSSIIIRFISGGMSPKTLEKKLGEQKSRLMLAEQQVAQVKGQLLPIFDLMLDYPPDWDTRVELVKNRDKRCSSCSSDRRLQVHHSKPLSKGGNNRLSNLVLLCESCHREKHGGKSFQKQYSTSDTLAISSRVQEIQGAINRGQDVEFLYKKENDQSFQKRRIKPTKLKEYEHNQTDGTTLCVEGYCYSRRADRVFALKRMRDLKQI